MIRFDLNVDSRKQHLFDVCLHIPAHHSDTLHLSLPAWIPGSYMIRDFARHLHGLSAVTEDGVVLHHAPLDKQRFALQTKGKGCLVRYQIYAFDTSVRTAYLDDNRGFFNGSSVFLQVEELNHLPHQIMLLSPKSSQRPWQVATGLTRATSTPKYAFGEYLADDYAHLIDCPVEMGQFDVLEFPVRGIPHHVVLCNKHYADGPRLVKDLQKLCELHVAMFCNDDVSSPPFEEYWFLVNILPEGFGGLEHRNSTALLCSTFDFPNPHRVDELSEGYKTFLSLASHEYFHAWNVCRIKPAEFVPYDLRQEVMTTQLWAYEGITSYYDDLSLYRAGIISFADYLKLLSKTLSRVERGQGQYKQSLAESSFYAWTKFYQQGEDALNNIVSYYTKGSILALWLDLSLRAHSQGRVSLDHMMRLLWQEFGRHGRGTSEADYLQLVARLSDQGLADALRAKVHAKEKLDLTSLLSDVGVEVTRRSGKFNDGLTAETQSYNPYLGILYKGGDSGLLVQSVLQDSPAELAGICAKDQLIAADNLQLTASNATQLFAQLPLAIPVEIVLFRQGRLLTLSVKLCQAPDTVLELKEMDSEKSKRWRTVLKD
ncbi:hypothetical protein P2G88_05450 [Aliiglaciecola sp. CAU 1673]|uniref:M61 family metallopeptidase n=1 Tax=Aliiglaciecola sp. CAU 1673 TaxID=3032595 RepID=UPI0023DA89BE|nr:PDZ domain-containing protein [Aliiglaciecola sp. CAU 1673]MDF2177689.1 hypothetical protein [Aliiglaciecola sp. CAU 1673]